MALIISSHRDVVRNDIPLRIENGYYIGLLDNLVGNIISYAVLQNKSIVELHKQGKVKFFFSEYEEFGMNTDFPTVDKKQDTIINVDVCSGSRYNKCDIALENVYKISKDTLSAISWEGYNIRYKDYNGASIDTDEAFEWVKLDVPVLSFIIPIEAPNNNWHGEAKISIEKVNIAIQILTRLLCYLS